MKVAATGIPWYAEEDWPELKALFTDSNRLHDRYRDWRRAAEETIRHLSKEDHVVVKVPVKPREFAAWCAAVGLQPNAEARSRYASLKAKEAVVGTPPSSAG